ncbi:antibiotic biosynthesis monooxygenase [Paenibacillus sp. UNC499MF]|uniref:antibiotic biosynthesis monooxygenase family protein n=1 Tax=Paenibacillus sp. UNC499MF TaxID=1502751 RepID=UPI00089FD458|nr:antibiotic biosynthesis monooxygenase [Paenibacillus sp. UNC499MF]SEG78326.1 heme oxygenase (staphylobilin-producing) [Paenibacillus sp. UNC499MF]
MYIAVNTIEVPNPAQMVEMFRKQAPNMKELQGFLGLEVWTDEQAIKVITKWENKEAFEAYTQSEVFKRSHGGHGGQEMKPKARLSYFEGETLI